MSEDKQYRTLVRAAILLTIMWVGWTIYDSSLTGDSVDENNYHAGNKYFEDGKYQEAINAYKLSVQESPTPIHAKRGIARSLVQLGKNSEAMVIFDEVISEEPDFGASYANRGILHDRLQNYKEAIADYRKAIQLDPELADGPSFLTRFLKNQQEKPPTIVDRMRYLQSELDKPPEERMLQKQEEDQEQKPYKL